MAKKEKGQIKEKWTERGEAIRAYFVRLFGKYDFRNERQFLYFGKWLIFISLALVEALVVLQGVESFSARGGWHSFSWMLASVAVLTACVALQLFAVKDVRKKIPFFVLDICIACLFSFFAGGVYSLIIYMLVLTLVYFESTSTKFSLILFVVGVVVYTVAYGLQTYFVHGAETWSFLKLLNLAAGFIVGITVHFIAVQIALAFYRQYLKLHKALQELEERKKELEKAYAVVAEVSALEERQRIAKDIHDTAGHSLTTVIMQTETAKRIVDSNPEEAKNKLIAANLQAKHALEELRNSVHLLSGGEEQTTLADALMEIIHESTDGTGITIRSEIADVSVLSAKRRFLCNTLKEGIANGLRHGGATAFWFELKEEDGRLYFLLSDNGKGLGEGGLRQGFGLTTMRERATALGGEVKFFSEEEEGFEIRLTLPTDGERYGKN